MAGAVGTGVEGFSHVGVCVTDFSLSTAFYTQVLGFSELFTMAYERDELLATMETPGAFTSRMLHRGDLRIELLHWHDGDVATAERRPMRATGMTHLCFRVADVEAVLEAAAAFGGVGLPGTLTELDGGIRTAYLTDPDGTRIECISGMPIF